MNNYWNKVGTFQKEYDEMQEAMYKGEFTYNKQELNTFYKYKRFYNDGDLPNGSWRFSLEEIKDYLEIQADIAVAKAYLRFNKNCDNKMLKAYAKDSLKGLKAFYGRY